MAISAFSIVWLWLRPELPKQLIYAQNSVVSYYLYALVKSIRHKQKKYEKYYYKCIETIKDCVHDIGYQRHMHSSDHPLQGDEFNKFIEDLERELQDYRKKKIIKKYDYDLFKIKADIIVNTLLPLQACCYGMYELLFI